MTAGARDVDVAEAAPTRHIARRAARPGERRARPSRRRRPLRPGPAGIAAAVVVAVAVTARFVARSHLWLDEALTVNIARLPLAELPGALRHDGSPPLYYVLLHGWMELFGTSTWAVRALSGVFSVAALPLAWRAGMLLGGRWVAAAALLFLATSPFAVLYATEARMYSLVILLTLAGGLALDQLWRGASWRASLVLGGVTGALLLTHYWSAWLLATVAAVLGWSAVRGSYPRRQGARRALVALAGGGLLFLPWLPVFVSQLRHTGAPWGGPPPFPGSIHRTLEVFAAGYRDAGPVPVLVLEALVVLALIGRAVDRGRVELSLRSREPARSLGLVVFGTLALGLAAAHVTGDAYAHRYASVVVAGVVLLAALGTAVFLDTRLRGAVVALVAGLGLTGLVPVAANERTQAPAVARSLRAEVGAGDVVAYCPDQLGPSVSRLLPAGVDQVTFPRGTGPERVDWVDYATVNASASPARFARGLLERPAGGDIWLVWAPGYRTFGRHCEVLGRELGDARPGWEVVERPSGAFPERMGLVRYPAG